MACVQPSPPPPAAAALWPRIPPSPRRSAAGKPYRISCVDNFRWKLPLGASESYGSISSARCTSSASSAKAATSIRIADVSSTVHTDLSLGDSMDSLTGAHTVISGYWAGPDSDDGSGYVEAILQRIV